LSRFYLKHTTFRRLDSVPFFRWNPPSWARSIKLLLITACQPQHKIEYINQAQRKSSARVKTSIKNIKKLTYMKPSTYFSSLALCGCDTWSRTLREEHRLRVSENRVLRRISGPKRDEVTGDLRKLHNEELHNLQFSPDVIKRISQGR
jgi:Txe/YoeB family toxin of Txe-Axe toxin-antitoxin module